MGFTAAEWKEVLGRPTDLDQFLLDPAALGGVHEHGVIVDGCAEHRLDLLVPLDLGEHRRVLGLQHQPVCRVAGQHQPTVAVHGLGDVHQQRLGDREAGVGLQDVDDLLGVVPGSACIPRASGIR